VNKRVIAIAVVAAVLVSGIWYLFIFSSQSSSIHKARTQTAAQNAQAASLRSQIVVLQQEQAQLSSAQAKLATLTAALPNKAALDTLIDQINDDAVQSGVDWQVLTPTKPALYIPGAAATAISFQGGMQSVAVALQVQGPYEQVLTFITKLYSLSRLLDVGSVNLANVGPGVVTTAQITTQMFYIPPAAGSTTATTVAP